MDLVHSTLKFISYERYKVFSIILIGLMVFCVSCQQTAIDPTTNKSATRNEIITNTDNKIESISGDIKRLDADFAVKLKELQNEYDAKLASITANTAGQKDKLLETQKMLISKAELSIKEIERKESIIATGLKFVQDTFPQLPYLSTIVGLGGVLFGGAAVADKNRANARIAELKTNLNSNLNNKADNV